MVVAGIDVSKALLNVSVADGPVHRVANSDPGIRRLLQHMARAGATQAACEATGGYERLPAHRQLRNGVMLLNGLADPALGVAQQGPCGFRGPANGRLRDGPNRSCAVLRRLFKVMPGVRVTRPFGLHLEKPPHRRGLCSCRTGTWQPSTR